MLRFVEESILTTNLNKAGETIVLLVVSTINLLLCRGIIRCLHDVIVWLGTEPMEPKGPIVFPDTVVQEEAVLAFSFPERRGHICSRPPKNMAGVLTLGEFAGMSLWK